MCSVCLYERRFWKGVNAFGRPAFICEQRVGLQGKALKPLRFMIPKISSVITGKATLG